MSVALLRIYDHFSQAQEAPLKDKYLAPAAEFAARILGPDAVLKSLRTEKTEAEFDDDEEVEEKPTKKIKPDTPYTLDEGVEEEQGPSLTFDWTARSSDGQQLLADEGQAALDVTEVILEGKVTLLGKLLQVRVEFNGHYDEPTVTIAITGTSAEGFFRQWAGDTWQPQLENLAVSEPVVLCCSAPTLFTYDRHCFFLKAGISMILLATPGPNLSELIEGPERLYLFGHLVDDKFNSVPPYLQTFPFFQMTLGKSIRLQGCYFDVSTKTLPVPSPSGDDLEEEEDEDESPGSPIPFAQLNLAGSLVAPSNLIYLWTDVPADDEVLAFRQAGPGYQKAWTLADLAPVLGDPSRLQQAFAGSPEDIKAWRYRVAGLEYFYDLSMKSLYSLASRLELLNKDASIVTSKVKVVVQRLILHCKIGAPDSNHALSLWAEGLGDIAGTTLPFDISWANGITLSAGKEGRPTLELFKALHIEPPPLPSTVVDVASYRLALHSNRPATLAILPLYKPHGMSVEEDEDGPVVADEPIVLSQPDNL